MTLRRFPCHQEDKIYAKSLQRKEHGNSVRTLSNVATTQTTMFTPLPTPTRHPSPKLSLYSWSPHFCWQQQNLSHSVCGQTSLSPCCPYPVSHWLSLSLDDSIYEILIVGYGSDCYGYITRPEAMFSLLCFVTTQFTLYTAPIWYSRSTAVNILSPSSKLLESVLQSEK